MLAESGPISGPPIQTMFSLDIQSWIDLNVIFKTTEIKVSCVVCSLFSLLNFTFRILGRLFGCISIINVTVISIIIVTVTIVTETLEKLLAVAKRSQSGR